METVENWVSLREFARNRGVRLSAVQKAIESGRVTAVKRDEKGRLKAIELNRAMAEWNGNTDLDQAARAGAPLLVEVNGPSTAVTTALRGQEHACVHEINTSAEAGTASGGVQDVAGPGQSNASGTGNDATVAPASGSGGDAKDPHGYLEARADRERTQAKNAELDYLERVGELVSVTAVREETFSVFRKIRDNIVGIGARLAPRIAAETDPVRVEHLINEETRKALDELSRALGVAAAGGVGECSPSLQ